MEVIIVDDGSTTVQVRRLNSGISKVFSGAIAFDTSIQTNQGQSAANNTGISAARGDWFGFNASDDLWLPTKLEMQIRVLQKVGDEYAVCFSDAWFMNNPYMKRSTFESAGKTQNQAFGIAQDPTRFIASGPHPIWMQTALIRADAVWQVGVIDRNLRYSQDRDFMFRLSLQTKFCFVSMPLVLIDRSPAESRHTGDTRDWHKEEFCLQMEQYRLEKQLDISEGLSRDSQQLARRHLACVHKAWANWHIERGDCQKARESVSIAAKYEISPSLIAKRAGLSLHLPFCAGR